METNARLLPKLPDTQNYTVTLKFNPFTRLTTHAAISTFSTSHNAISSQYSQPFTSLAAPKANPIFHAANKNLFIKIYFDLRHCREEENLLFCFGALFNSTLNFTQSGWHIPFSPDLHFRLAKRVSSQNHSLRLETATRTDGSLVAPA